jgi:ABC-type transport system involved in multi-copper enzyme maturation permease subunit
MLMPSFVESCAAWLRSRFSWSNSRQSWEERLAGLFLLVSAVVLGWYGTRLALSQQVLLWGVLALALTLLLRRGWLKLFGPVLFYDVVRTSRRGRYILFRCLYAGLLTLLLVWVYYMWSWRLDRTGRIPAHDMPEFAESFFVMFMVVQFAAVWLLTPGYTAGAVAEEKDRRTLEFLLATDLRNREIVLSKLASRLANLTLLILTGLPILSMLQLLGGVDPNLVLAGFAATGLTMLSLAGLSILNSVLLRKPRDAIVLTYLGAVAYLVLAGVTELVVTLNPSWGLGGLAVTWGDNPVTVLDVVRGFDAGNIVAAWIKLVGAVSGGAHLDDVLPAMLRNYAIFHGAVAVVCSTWAVARLRAVALKEMYGRAQQSSLAVRVFGRPRVGSAPMLWKEVFAEPGIRLNWLGRLFIAVLVIGGFVPVWFIVQEYLEHVTAPRPWMPPGGAWRFLNEAMNLWVRVVGTGVACLTLLAVAVRASTSVGGERDRQTFDSLLTSPLDSTPILFAKWLGSILSVRWAWLWLGLIAGLGLVTGGLHPIALPLLLMAWVIYAAVLASIGLWFSTVARTTLRATLYTLFTVVGISFGHWLLYMCCIPVFWMGGQPGPGLDWIPQFQAVGLTPPVTLGFLAFGWHDFDDYGPLRREWLKFGGYACVGLFFYFVAAAGLWGGVSARFRVVTGRTGFRPPERSHRPRVPAPLPRPRPTEHAAEVPYAILAADEWDQLPTALPANEEADDEDGDRQQGPDTNA